MVVGGGGEIMAGCGWSWLVGMELWLVVGGDDKIMTGRGWSWVVAAKLRLVVGGHGWSHDLVMPIKMNKSAYLAKSTQRHDITLTSSLSVFINLMRYDS